MKLPDQTWSHVAEASGLQWLWTRGLVKDPSTDCPFFPVQEDQAIAWSGQADFTGDICVDGSRLGVQKAAQAGWSAVQMDDEAAVAVIAASWGLHHKPCPSMPEQSRGRSLGQ